jgi:pimeloyl-ACP methyl ester carboxylesterase
MRFLIFLFLVISTAVFAQDCPLSYASLVKKMTLNDSVTIGYLAKGTGKTTLLFVHGLGGNSSHWSQNLDDLSTHFRCIAVDLPGYGFSSQRTYATPTLTFYANTLLQFIQKQKLKNVVLVGHSMGGQTAIIATLQKPSVIKKLILVAPAGLETFSEAEANILKQYATPTFYQSQTEPAIRAAFASNFTKIPPTAEELIQDRLALRRCANFESYCQVIAQGVRGMLAQPVQTQLSQISLPTLLIFGEDDRLIPNRILHKTLTIKDITDIGKSTISNLQLNMIPQAGHLVMYEQPKQFNQIITQFLQ